MLRKQEENTMQKEDRQQTTPKRGRPLSLLIGVGLLVAIALFVVYNVTTLASQHIQNTTKATMQIPKGTWQSVLNGYVVMSIVAAPNNSAVLYACAFPVQTTTPTPYRPGTSIPAINYVLLHSTDGGTHWQEVTHLNGGCQIAVNSTNSDDIYTTALSAHRASNGQVPDVLRHSTDGGRSWSDIAPALLSNNTQLATVWHVQQLSMVGNELFGTQQFPAQSIQPQGRNLPPSVVTRLSVTRLVESSDGGHTWRVIDNNRGNSGMGERDYIVSPTHPQVVYELAGTQWPGYLQPAMPPNNTLYGGNLTLYKTDDGGETWTKLGENLPLNSKLQIAANNPDIVYVGSTVGVMPLRSYDTGQDIILQPLFSLRMSMNGGATWRTLQAPEGISFVQNWFVDANGQVYASTGSTPHIQPIATSGTVVVPSATAQIRVGGAASNIIEGSVADIQRYNPTNNTWSIVTQTPQDSALLAVTPNTNSHNVSLWMLSNNNGKLTLYRQETV